MKKTIIIILGVVISVGIMDIAGIVYTINNMKNSDLVSNLQNIENSVQTTLYEMEKFDNTETIEEANSSNINSTNDYYLLCPNDWIQNNGEDFWSCANPEAGSAGISSNIMLTITETTIVPKSDSDCEKLGKTNADDINSEEGDLPTKLISSLFVTKLYKSCNYNMESTSGDITLKVYQRYIDGVNGKAYILTGMYSADDAADMASNQFNRWIFT